MPAPPRVAATGDRVNGADAWAWSIEQLPDQTGRTTLVTGAAGAFGVPVATALVRAGGRVVLADADPGALATAAAAVRTADPEATGTVTELHLDLASFDHVRRAVDALDSGSLGSDALHAVIHLDRTPALPRHRTVDGIERDLAVQHYGPFLLTGLLMPRLLASQDGRVVSLATPAHRAARRAPVEEPRHSPTATSPAAVQLAPLLFTHGLHTRLTAADLPVRATAAHPGIASASAAGSILDAALRALRPSGSAALPILMAATADVPGVSYCGPTGPFQLGGRAGLIGRSRLARDDAAADRLWELSERVTGIRVL